jgi:CheY-like chemotaxis protein
VKILLADDSVTAQNMGKKILSEAGHEVVCVSNGAAALKKVSEQEPDLVILDIYMPGYSGLEVCQRLKEGTATANLPVVLTVGKLEPFRKEDAQKVRAEALIVKPFEASELAAAVARFGEIVAANPPKPKGRGKLGPPPKAKPQWDEPSEDEFVTTTQKLEEEGYTPGSPKTAAEAVSEEMEAAVEAHPAAANSEFEAAPALEAQEFSAAATQTATRASAEFGGVAGARITETPGQAGAAAEFKVQAEPAVVAGDEAGTRPMAAAAAAGADFGGSGEMSEFPVGLSPAQDFEVAAPPEIKMQEPSAFTPQIAADAAGFPAVPDAPPAPELSAATAEPYAPPEVDPAFDPDRTQWASQFPTRFGIAEEAPAEDAQTPTSAELEPQAESAPPDEIAAILSNLPGGSASMEAPRQSEEGVEFGQRPWPLEPSRPDNEAWKAEEVEMEDHDSSVSLADEMEKASGARDLESHPQPSLAEAEAPAKPEEVSPARIVESGEEESQLASAAQVEFTQPNAAEEASAAETSAADAEPYAAPSVPEVKTGPPTPDRVAGVMQSAAMAIATRATVSAVASQLHQQPAENAGTGPSAIEELVGQVLERLKPKLIAEIKRELKTPEEE